MQVLYMQYHRAGVSGRFIDAQQHLSSYHQACNLSLASLFGNQFTRVLTTAQHRDPVGKFEHFTQLMCDENDGLALHDKAMQDAKEFCCLLWSQYAGGFIHDEDVSAALENFEDFDWLMSYADLSPPGSRPSTIFSATVSGGISMKC